MRLQKYLSLCGIASRRKSEQIILEGRVKVNESIIDKVGYKVKINDIVEVDSEIITPERKVYIALNKPRNTICTHNDKTNRKTIYDIIDYKKKLFSIGRLDKESTGLIILTNDGDFANKVIHPSNNIIKEYYVESYLEPDNKLIEDFKKGIQIDNSLYKAENIKKTDNKNILKIYLKEGKKREIRLVYKYFFIKIKELKRVAIGGLRLDELKIKEGEFINLSYEKIYNLVFNKVRKCINI